jgi:ApbE superfamily uncharacterized protein (UPF0280 family)
MCEPRFYRHWIKDDDLVSFELTVKQTDLCLRARRNLKDKALDSVLKHRGSLESYIARHPIFLTTLQPYQAAAGDPAIVREMARVSQLAGVGPMAAVAGAIAEAIGRDLLAFTPEIVVENGGDIYLKISKKRLVGIYAGQSALSKRIALEIMPGETPLGICTSSGTVGHSLSLGSADAVVVLSPSTALADAAATALCNMVKSADDIPQTIERAQSIAGLRGLVVIMGGKMGVWGKVKIVPLD